MASVRCLDSAFGYDSYGTATGSGGTQIPNQGRILRNIVEGADLVMSHILHFYHLAALDYIDTDTPGSIIENQSPWSPSHTRHRTDVFGEDGKTIDWVPSLSGNPSASVNHLVTNYVTALNIRRKCHELAAHISGKQPHTPAFIPGGITSVVDATAVSNMRTLLADVIDFVDNDYLKTDIKACAIALSSILLTGPQSGGLGEGCKKYLAYGTFPESGAPIGEPLNFNEGLLCGGFLDTTATTGSFPGNWLDHATSADMWKIKEYIKYSHYGAGALGEYDGLQPINGVTKVDYQKETNDSSLSAAYSWAKAPRYVTGSGSANVHVCEVGPLARILVNYARNNGTTQTTVNNFMNYIGLTSSDIPALRSVLGRHAARALEASIVANAMSGWLTQLQPSTSITGNFPSYRHRNIPTSSATGAGFTEAPRGALSHWIRIDGKKVSNYQCVVPTTWNVSPKDTYGQHGPIEHALSGTYVLGVSATSGMTNNDSIKLTRIIRSFDPCIACTVHVVSPDKKTVTKFEVGTAAPPLCNSK